jgi:hypothetical protein
MVRLPSATRVPAAYQQERTAVKLIVKLMPGLAAFAAFQVSAADGVLTSDDVLAGFIPAMCKKIIACTPDRVPSENACRDAMKTSFDAIAADPAFKAALQMSRPQLDACLTALDAMACEGLEGSPPTECGFMQQQSPP